VLVCAPSYVITNLLLAFNQEVSQYSTRIYFPVQKFAHIPEEAPPSPLIDSDLSLFFSGFPGNVSWSFPGCNGVWCSPVSPVRFSCMLLVSMKLLLLFLCAPFLTYSKYPPPFTLIFFLITMHRPRNPPVAPQNSWAENDFASFLVVFPPNTSRVAFSDLLLGLPPLLAFQFFAHGALHFRLSLPPLCPGGLWPVMYHLGASSFFVSSTLHFLSHVYALFSPVFCLEGTPYYLPGLL